MIINVNKDTEAGTYPIAVNSYIHKDALWESKTVNLEVEACSDQVVEEVEEINETETVEVVDETEEGTTEGEEVQVLGPTTTTEVSFTKKPLFPVLMAILNFVIIIAVVFFVVKFVGKKQ